MNVDPLAALIQSLAKPAIHLGHQFIADGDEEALMPGEADSFSDAATGVRRRSGAARIIARVLLERLHHRGIPIPKAPSGAPIWPRGIVGSLAHDHTVAVAAVARAVDISCLGIDIEPAEPLPDDLADFISTPAERLRYSKNLLQGRHLFVVKEAVFKAVESGRRNFPRLQGHRGPLREARGAHELWAKGDGRARGRKPCHCAGLSTLTTRRSSSAAGPFQKSGNAQTEQDERHDAISDLGDRLARLALRHERPNRLAN